MKISQTEFSGEQTSIDPTKYLIKILNFQGQTYSDGRISELYVCSR